MIHRGSAQLDVLKRRLDERAKAVGLSLRQASIQAQLAPGYATDIVNNRNKSPSNQALSALAAALDCDLPYLTGEQELPRRPPASAANEGAAPAGGATGRRIPVIRANMRGEGAAETVDSTLCPAPLLHVPGAYAVLVANEEMSPRYEVGEIVYVHPGLPVRPGDYVVARLTTGEVGPSKLLPSEGGDYAFERVRAHTRVTVPAAEVAQVHRIVGSWAYHGA